MSERGRNRSETRVGRVRLNNHPDHEKGRMEENKVNPKRGRKKATESAMRQPRIGAFLIEKLF